MGATKISIQYHAGTGKWTATLDETAGHTFTFDSSRAVKRFANDLYEAEGLGRNIVWLEDDLSVASEPTPEPVAVGGYFQVSPHSYGYAFTFSLYSDVDLKNYLPGQDYTGTAHSLDEALTYASNVVQARCLRKAQIDVRTLGRAQHINATVKPDPEVQAAAEFTRTAQWTTEEILQREG